MTNEDVFAKTALTGWDIWITRTSKLFDSFTDEKMMTEIAPGKNRPVYLLGHLLAVNDSMIEQLRLGESSHVALREIYIKQPDRAVAVTPSIAELRQYWKDLNAKLAELFAALPAAAWLERHGSVSEEDFAREPHRNRLALLLSRTGHVAYHLGQLVLAAK